MEFRLFWAGDHPIVSTGSLYVWSNVDGSNRHQFDIGSDTSIGGTFFTTPTATDYVSPDKHWWVFETQGINAGTNTNDRHVWLTDLVKGTTTKLPVSGISFWQLEFAPDSKTLAASDGASMLYLVSLSNPSRKPLIREGKFVNLLWSPDGSRLVLFQEPAFDGNTLPLFQVIRRDGDLMGYYPEPWFYEIFEPERAYWIYVSVDWVQCP